MPYLRQRTRIPSGGRVTIRLTPEQRDLLIGSASTPQSLGHLLHRAAVREGRLSIRVDRDSLDALIMAAAKAHAPDRSRERALAALSRYLESLEDRFADSDERHVR